MSRFVLTALGYAAVDRKTGETATAQELAVRLPWRDHQDQPHEPRMPSHQYVVKDKCDDQIAYAMLEFIIQHHPESYDAYFRAYRYPMRYLDVGSEPSDRRYWRTRIGKTWMLNRCFLGSVEPPRRKDEGAKPISLEEWGAEHRYWPRGSGFGEWRRIRGRWVFFPSDEPVTVETKKTLRGKKKYEQRARQLHLWHADGTVADLG